MRDKKEIIETATNFLNWLLDMEYCSEEDVETDIDEMIEDFEAMKKACPRMFNLLRNISDI